MVIYVVCLSFFWVSRFSSKDLWFGWCAVHRRQLNQQNLDRRRLCGILVLKQISHCDPLRTLTDEIPKPTTPTSDICEVCEVFGVWPGKMASRKDLASSVDLGEANWRSSNRTPSSGGHPPQHPSKTSRHLQRGGLHHRFCHPFLPLEAAIWCTLYVIWYYLTFFYICRTCFIPFLLCFFASLLLCFLGWLCCKLQILRPHLLPIVRNKWICICSRKHLAGFRQRQLPLSTSCLFLPFLAPFRIISIISSICQV